jgi:hypothetical protein
MSSLNNAHIQKVLAKNRENREKFNYKLISEMIKSKNSLDKVVVDYVDDWGETLYIHFHQGWVLGGTWGDGEISIKKSEYREEKLKQLNL